MILTPSDYLWGVAIVLVLTMLDARLLKRTEYDSVGGCIGMLVGIMLADLLVKLRYGDAYELSVTYIVMRTALSGGFLMLGLRLFRRTKFRDAVAAFGMTAGMGIAYCGFGS